MTERKLKVGQIGVGGFGAARRNLMRQTGLFDLAVAYDYNEKALAQAKKQDGARPVGSIEALLSEPDLEAVIISTGATTHAEFAIAAAKRGLHVFVEKPLCSTPEEVRQVLAAGREHNVVIGMGHNDHSSSAESRTIKDLMDNGEMGKIVAFEAVTAHSGGFHINPGDWRGDPDKNPGGMLFQCGVHKLHELLYYFGPVRSISCVMRYDVHTTATADSAICTVQFASGVVGSLHAYHVTPYRHTLNLYGTKASLYCNHRYFSEGTSLLRQNTRLDGQEEPTIPVELDHSHEDKCGNLRSFYKAVTEGGDCYPNALDGARALGAIFAADHSAQLGGVPVMIGEDGMFDPEANPAVDALQQK